MIRLVYLCLWVHDFSIYDIMHPKLNKYDVYIYIVLVLAFLLYVLRNRYKQMEQLTRIKRLRRYLYSQSNDFVIENNKKIAILENELRKMNDKSGFQHERLEEQKVDLLLTNQTVEWKWVKKKTARNRLMSSDIYRRILDYVENQKVLSDKDWEDLHLKLNEEYCDFKRHLQSYHFMSEHEYHVCMLIKMELPPSSMAILLGCTVSAVSKARSRLYDKFFGKGGTAKEFDEFIKSL